MAYIDWTFRPLETKNYKWKIPLIMDDFKTFINIEARGKSDHVLFQKQSELHVTPQLNLPMGGVEMIVS